MLKKFDYSYFSESTNTTINKTIYLNTDHIVEVYSSEDGYLVAIDILDKTHVINDNIENRSRLGIN